MDETSQSTSTSNGPNAARIVQAWRHVTDAEVHRTLCARDEVPPEVYAIVEAEAGRRKISPDDEFHDQPTPLTRMAARLMRLARFAQRHYIISGYGFGVLVLAIVNGLINTLASLPGGNAGTLLAVVSLVVSVSGAITIAGPLLSYTKAVAVAAAFASGYFTYGLGSLTLFVSSASTLTGAQLWYGMATCLLLAALLTSCTCVAVFIRRRYWPVYPPGHCTGCGYNLFGLTEPRCPECGLPFDPADLTTEASKEAPA